MRRFPEIRRAVGARRPLALLATVVAATLAAGCGGDSETPPATAQRAATPHAGAARTFYVDKDSMAGPCRDDRKPAAAADPGTPWCSLTRAIRAAPSGSTVLVRRGRYPRLVVEGAPRRGWVTLTPAPGETVTLDSFDLENTRWVRFRRFRINGATNTIGFGNRHIDVLDSDITVSTHVRPSAHLRFVGNVIHDLPGPPANSLDGVGLWIVNGTAGQTTDVVIRGNRFSHLNNDAVFTDGTRILIEDNVFEHIQSPDNTWAHADVIQTQGVFDITIRDNYGVDNDSGILNSAALSHGWVIENNVFIRSDSQPVQLDNKVQDLKLVNNTFWQSGGATLLRWDASAPRNPHRWLISNNIVTRIDVDPRLNTEQDHNLVLIDPFHGPPVGVGSTLGVAPKFVDPAAGDYRLAQGSPGIDAGGSVEVPRRDRAGNARFDDPAAPDRGGSIVDIGGYEYRPDARLGPVATGGASG